MRFRAFMPTVVLLIFLVAVVALIGAANNVRRSDFAPGPGTQAGVQASKCSPVADLRALRLRNLRAPGTLGVSEDIVQRWFRTRSDTRNFAVQVSVGDVQAAFVSGGREFPANLQQNRLIAVVSHGRFDSVRDNVMGLRPPETDSAGKPLVIPADVDVVLLDASTGQFFAEALLSPGCHKE